MDDSALAVPQVHPPPLEGRDKVQAVAHSLRAEGFDASEDGTGRGTPLVANAVPVKYRGDLHEGTDTLVPFDTTQVTSRANYSKPKPGDPCHPLAAGAHPPAVAFDWESGGDSRGLDPKRTAQLQTCQTPPVAFQEAQTGCREYDTAGTLRSEGPGHDPVGTRVRRGMAVRRLTPRECERLQGFPDDFTRIPWRGKPASVCPDGHRYRALGNSMAVNCMRWIGERIAMVEREGA